MLRTFLLRLLAVMLAAGVAALFLWPVKHHRAVHPVTDAMLLQADSGGEWLTYGRDYSNQRFVPYTEINRGSIKHLQLIWQQGPRRLVKTYQRNESTPLVADGMLIYTDPGMRLASPGKHLVPAANGTGRPVWALYRQPGDAAREPGQSRVRGGHRDWSPDLVLVSQTGNDGTLLQPGQSRRGTLWRQGVRGHLGCAPHRD